MRPFRHPDEVLWRLLEMRRNLYSLRAQNPIEQEGFVYSEKCGCGGLVRTMTVEGHYACLACEKPWSLETVALLRNQVRRSHVHADHRMHLISQADTLERILSLRGWDRRIYLELFCYERRTFLGTAAEARKRWVRHSHIHTDKKVRTRIESARQTIRRRLEVRGLLAG